MSTATDPLLETLVTDFGGNYVFALDLLEMYREDRASVDPSWRTYFDKATGRPLESASSPVTVIVNEAPRPAEAPAPAAGAPRQTLQRQESQPPAQRERSRAVALPTILPGDILQPIRGGAVRIVENMEASLEIPTATSVRTIPVRMLEENRRLINQHREVAGAGKVSFTHLMAWAIVRALDTFPRLNDAYAEVDGSRIGSSATRSTSGSRSMSPEGRRAHPGGAQHQERRASSTSPSSWRRSTTWWRARARAQLTPDDFQGTTISLTNPGTVGTTSVGPAPDAGPGRDHRRPARSTTRPSSRRWRRRTLAELGISKVMTMTCTYDHRIIQGAESGAVPRHACRRCSRATTASTNEIFDRPAACRTSPCAGRRDRPARLSGAPARDAEEIAKEAARAPADQRLPRARPPDRRPRSARHEPSYHPELDPSTYGLHASGTSTASSSPAASARRATARRTLREILETLRQTYCGTIGVEYMHIQTPSRSAGCSSAWSRTRN